VAAGARSHERVDSLGRPGAPAAAGELAVGVAAVAEHDGRQVGRDELGSADRDDRLADRQLEQALLEGPGAVDIDGDHLALLERDHGPRVEADEVVVASELLLAALAIVDVDDRVEAAAGLEREGAGPRRDEPELVVGRRSEPAAAGEVV